MTAKNVPEIRTKRKKVMGKIFLKSAPEYK